MIGGYIHKYELLGSDRAKYGDKLIEKLAQSLGHIPRTQKRELNRYRLFYKVYPQIGESVTPQLKANLKLKELALLQTGGDALAGKDEGGRMKDKYKRNKND